MRVGIDCTSLLSYPTGVDTYVIELVLSLNQIDHETHFYIFINHEDREKFSGQLYDNFSIIPIAIRSRIVRLLAQQFFLPVLATYLRLDVIHSPSFFIPLFRGNQHHLVTIHDVTMFSLPAYHTRFRRSRIFRNGVVLSAQRSNIIIVPSVFVKKEVIRLLPRIDSDKIRVIPMGIGSHFSPPMKNMVESFPAHLKQALPYILFVGNIEPRKNLNILIESYRKLVKTNDLKENLLIVGNKDWGYPQIKNLACHPEILNRVHFTGYIDKKTLVTLYRNAQLFIFPSVEEGFGFPPLEAMACGIPTIAADTSSLRENLHGAVELVPPNDSEALRKAILKMLRDEKRREHFRKKGLKRATHFRWENTAKMTIECYKELYNFRHK